MFSQYRQLTIILILMALKNINHQKIKKRKNSYENRMFNGIDGGFCIKMR